MTIKVKVGILKNMEERPDMKKIAAGIIVGTVILGGALFFAWKYSQKQGIKLTLPSGGTYTGETSGFQETNPPTAPQRFTAPADVEWITYQGKIYPYTFSYPKTLPLANFPNDPLDAVGIAWGNLNPQFNILLDIENIEEIDPANVGNVEAFVRNWWKRFSGLKGVLSVDKFVNTNGLKGYKAIYINQADQTPNVDIFFEVPQNPKLVIHLANGILDPLIFNRIVDSVNWLSPTPTPTSPPQPPSQ